MRFIQTISITIALCFGPVGMLELRAEPARFDLQHALDNAEDGATITVPAGVINGPIRIAKPITLIAGGLVILDGQGEGDVVQIGSPVELFERPAHTFVGHFIGSPGMNLLPCRIDNGVPYFAENRIKTVSRDLPAGSNALLQIGVRPEFVTFSSKGIPVDIVKVSDTGRYRIVEVRHQDATIKLLAMEGQTVPQENAHIRFDPAHTRIYADGWAVGEGKQ